MSTYVLVLSILGAIGQALGAIAFRDSVIGIAVCSGLAAAYLALGAWGFVYVRRNA